MKEYWFGELPDGWEAWKLKHICQLLREKTDDSQNYIGLENIESGSACFIATDSSPTTENIAFQTGDVLFGKLRPYLAKVWEAEFSGIASSEFLVLRPSHKIRSGYLKFVLLSPLFIDLVNGSTFGTKMPRADWQFIGNQWIPVPPINIQTAIEDIIHKRVNEINSLIISLSKQLDNLVNLRKSKLYEMLSEISSCQHMALRRFAKLNPATQMPSTGFVEYLPMDCIKDGYFIHRSESINELSKSLNPFADGDILLAKVTPCFENGNLCIARNVINGLGLCSTELFVLRLLDDRVLPDYLLLLLQTDEFRQTAISEMRGTGGLKRIPPEFLLSYKFPIPDKAKQSLIVNKIKSFDDKIVPLSETVSAKIESLKEYRASWLTETIRGVGVKYDS